MYLVLLFSFCEVLFPLSFIASFFFFSRSLFFFPLLSSSPLFSVLSSLLPSVLFSSHFLLLLFFLVLSFLFVFLFSFCLFYLVLFSLYIFSHLMLSYLILSYLILSYLFSFCLFLGIAIAGGGVGSQAAAEDVLIGDSSFLQEKALLRYKAVVGSEGERYVFYIAIIHFIFIISLFELDN